MPEGTAERVGRRAGRTGKKDVWSRHEVKVFGPRACFTRPESKVERLSYEVMTPSAARGILEAILWKPQIRWEVREIRVLKPIKRISGTTNEINHRQTYGAARRLEGYLADSIGNRTRRHNVFLKDVSYVIVADMRRTEAAAREGTPLRKWSEMFERRLARGQCFSRPYLGIREHAASFEHVSEEEDSSPMDLDLDLGPMFYDFHHVEDPDGPLSYVRHDSGPDELAPRIAHGRVVGLFFDARLVGGVLRVPRREDLVAAFGGGEPGGAGASPAQGG